MITNDYCESCNKEENINWGNIIYILLIIFIVIFLISILMNAQRIPVYF